MITTINEFRKINENIKIPNIDDSKYLLINNTISSIQFLIQDKNIIYAYSEILKKPQYYQIINTAAIDGYGPLLYDTMMLYLDKPVRPNRSLSIDAYNIWKKYLNMRIDVYKIKINDSDNNYWDTIDLNFKHINNKESISIINNLYTIYNNTRKTAIYEWYNNSYLNFSKPFEDQYPKWKENRFNIAKKWFIDKYKI